MLLLLLLVWTENMHMVNTLQWTVEEHGNITTSTLCLVLLLAFRRSMLMVKVQESN